MSPDTLGARWVPSPVRRGEITPLIEVIMTRVIYLFSAIHRGGPHVTPFTMIGIGGPSEMCFFKHLPTETF